jgi:hypothetical protein
MLRSQNVSLVMPILCTLVAAIAGVSGPALAASLEQIQGAWGVNDVPCDEIFATKDGKATLATSFGQSAGGFIVNGRQVQAPNATCRMLSSKEKGDLFTFVLDCKEQIIFDTTQISVRLIDANTLVRTHADFPELDTQYRRCK